MFVPVNGEISFFPDPIRFGTVFPGMVRNQTLWAKSLFQHAVKLQHRVESGDDARFEVHLTNTELPPKRKVLFSNWKVYLGLK